MPQIIINNESLVNTLTKESTEYCFNELKRIYGDVFRNILPRNKEFINKNEIMMYFYLLSATQNIMESDGFEKHRNEYNNNFKTAFFVTLFSDVLKGLGLEIQLEPDIIGHNKKPDILASQGGVEIYFECKNPINPNPENLIIEQRQIFDFMKDYISNEYSIACFYKRKLSEDELGEISNSFRKNIDFIDIKENTEILNDLDLGIRFIISGVSDDINKESEIEVLGIPIFNTGYCNANGINRFGKNIVFYKEASQNTIFDQLKKSKGKVPKGRPYIAVINISSDRFDVNDYKKRLKSKFDRNDNNSISGIVLVEFGFSRDAEVIVEMEWIENTNADVKLGGMDNFFTRKIKRRVDVI